MLFDFREYELNFLLGMNKNDFRSIAESIQLIIKNSLKLAQIVQFGSFFFSFSKISCLNRKKEKNIRNYSTCKAAEMLHSQSWKTKASGFETKSCSSS